MNGLNQVRDAVLAVLTGAKLTAVASYAGPAKRYAGPVVTVDVAETMGRTAGLCSYLGQSWDEDSGTVRELYGRQLEVGLSLEVRAPAAADCETAMETAAEALLCTLPSGLRPGEQSWEAVCWEKETQMFLRRGRLACRAFFLAQTDQEGETLLDFILKGVMTS